MKLLSFLRRIRLFFRTQRKFRFYSSSLLVAYDARRLWQHCYNNKDDTSTSREIKFDSSAPSNHTISDADASKETASVPVAHPGTRITLEAPASVMLKKGVSLSNSGLAESIEDEKISNQSGSCSPYRKIVRWLPCPCSAESYAKIYDKQNDTEDKCDWVRANMIDFTHIFPADDDGSLDLNYLEGIDNLFKLMETFVVRNLVRFED